MAFDFQNLTGHLNFMSWWISARSSCPEGPAKLWASRSGSGKLFSTALFCSRSFKGLDKDFIHVNLWDPVRQ